MTTISKAQVDRALYPFESKYLQLDAGKMHYIDEGVGDILLFVHGTPTWSFLYRDFIKAFSATHRCIAIDHIGFGLSDKPTDFVGTPEAHAANLSKFIQQLELENITLVVHDFGGPIGLGAALQHPNRIKQLVVFNTWLWATQEDKAAQKIDRFINSRLGHFLYLRMNVSPKSLLKRGFADKRKLSKTVHQHYVQPFPNKASRYGLLRLGQALVGASDWYQSQWEQLHQLETKDWLILWGMQDEFIPSTHLERWRKRLPQAQVEIFECGHFVQEEVTQEAIAAIRAFLVTQ